MAEHLEETGSGWIVQHCRRLDLIISGLNGVRYFHKKNIFFFIKIYFILRYVAVLVIKKLSMKKH